MLPLKALRPITTPHSNAEDVELAPPAEPRLAAALILRLLKAYKVLISPLFTGCCRYYPSCSDYAREAVLIHGAVRGLWLAGRRLGRCQPFGGSGVDPVPRCTSGRRSRPGPGQTAFES